MRLRVYNVQASIWRCSAKKRYIVADQQGAPKMISVRHREQIKVRQRRDRRQSARAFETTPFRFIARVSFGRALHGVEGVEPAPATRVAKPERWKAARAKRKRS
jgi:hypothetical protein